MADRWSDANGRRARHRSRQRSNVRRLHGTDSRVPFHTAGSAQPPDSGLSDPVDTARRRRRSERPPKSRSARSPVKSDAKLAFSMRHGPSYGVRRKSKPTESRPRCRTWRTSSVAWPTTLPTPRARWPTSSATEERASRGFRHPPPGGPRQRGGRPENDGTSAPRGFPGRSSRGRCGCRSLVPQRGFVPAAEPAAMGSDPQRRPGRSDGTDDFRTNSNSGHRRFHGYGNGPQRASSVISTDPEAVDGEPFELNEPEVCSATL